MKDILVAIDGSKPSLRALEHSAKLAKAIGAALTLLVVRQFVVGRQDVFEVWSNEEVQNILERAREVVANAGSPALTIVEEESRDVAFTIVDIAIKRGVDMIVMGASGMGALKAFVIGSVSAEVLRKAACPVTIVH